MICTFFGHRDVLGLDVAVLERSIEELIQQGVYTFYVGNQGGFDRQVLGCLKRLKATYPQISYAVVLAYLPTNGGEYEANSLYPDIEEGPQRFAIERRNNYLIDHAAYCIAYVCHPYGGAYRFVRQAKRKGLTVINLGNAEI